MSGNPFRVLPRSELGGIYVPPNSGQVATAAGVLNSTATVVEVLAPRGFGKSTLLAAVADRLDRRQTACLYHYLPFGQPNRLPPLYGFQVLLLDEAQRLSWWNRCRLSGWLRAAPRRLITGTHRPRPLRSYSHQCIALPPLTGAHLRAVFARRIAASGGDPQQIGLDANAATLLAGDCSDLRQAESVLYEVFQTLEAPLPRTIGVPDIRRAAGSSIGGVDDAGSRWR